MKTRAQSFLSRRRASVLVIVMWVAFGLVSVALYFAHSMEMELRAADSQVASLQAEQAIEAGALYVSNILANLGNQMLPSTNNYLVANVSVGQGRFWLIGRDTNDSQLSHRSPSPSFGLVDEASKVNLNASDFNNYTNLLIDLPQMTYNLTACEYDWHTSSTNSPSQGGAKTETYSTLTPPYMCKCAPYETTWELGLVYGMNLDILFQEDINMNGALDPNENDGMKTPPNDNADGNLDPGILRYLTVYTHEPTNIGSTNRILVTSTSSLQSFLTSNLSSAEATTYMQPFNTGGAPTSVLDFYNRSGMPVNEFMQIEPFLMGPHTVGLINVNTATATALACIPGIGYNNAQSILSYRQGNSGQMNSVAWLKDALSSLGTSNITQAGPWVTPFSWQFTADIAAVGANGRGYRRVRFVFDCSGGTPQIIYRQDLTFLGWALGKDIHDQLLAGKLKT